MVRKTTKISCEKPLDPRIVITFSPTTRQVRVASVNILNRQSASVLAKRTREGQRGSHKVRNREKLEADAEKCYRSLNSLRTMPTQAEEAIVECSDGQREAKRDADGVYEGFSVHGGWKVD